MLIITLTKTVSYEIIIKNKKYYVGQKINTEFQENSENIKSPILVIITGSGISVALGLGTYKRTDGLRNGFDTNKVCNFHTWQHKILMVY